MQKQQTLENEYFLEITDLFSSLLGINNLVFKGLKGESTFPVHGLIGDNYIETKKNTVLLNSMKKIVNDNFENYLSLTNVLDKKHLLKKIADEFIYGTILFPENEAKNELLNNNSELVKNLSCFLSFLQNFAVKTYEQRGCTASFIVSKAKNSSALLSDSLNSLGIDFFAAKNGLIEYEEIYKYIKSVRLVDSLSLSFVTDKNFKIIGLARKKKDHVSIKEQFQKHCPNEFNFVYLEDKSINWINSQDVLLHFQNAQWKIKDYEMINAIVQQCLRFNSCKDARKHIDKFIELFKSLSQENIGALFVFVDNIYSRKYSDANKCGEYTPYDIDFLLDQLLNKTDNDDLEITLLLKKIISECRDITEMDKYLLKLIASVDGAIIIDNKLNLVDYGRMIKTQELNNLFRDFYLEEESSYEGYMEYDLENPSKCNINGGARSLAAYNASTYGTAIKISEDGGIDIYYRRHKVYSI